MLEGETGERVNEIPDARSLRYDADCVPRLGNDEEGERDRESNSLSALFECNNGCWKCWCLAFNAQDEEEEG